MASFTTLHRVAHGRVAEKAETYHCTLVEISTHQYAVLGQLFDSDALAVQGGVDLSTCRSREGDHLGSVPFAGRRPWISRAVMPHA